MSSVVFKQAREAFDALAELGEEPVELLSTEQRLDQLDRISSLERILPALRHELVNELAATAAADELGGSLVRVLADRLRIYRGEAHRLIEEAADLGQRRAFSGEALAPRLEHTAAAQQAGLISAEHVRIIRAYVEQLPRCVDEPTRADAEHELAKVAAAYRPDELKKFADWYESVLNPDGNFCDEDRARRRGITISPQGRDGMSRLSGWLDPELRAGLDAVLAKWAAPGMCNPRDQQPTINDQPSEQTIDDDSRSAAQRNHDAVNMMVRATLMSGELGTHQGLPVTITATVALEDLQAKAGMATTGGNTVLPVKDLIRMASHAYNFLLIFDDPNRLQLYRGRDTRLATPAQRLVLYATERGCTHPGCTVPAYWCQVHHATKDWKDGGKTDIDDLTLSCGPDNRKVTEDGWTTRKRKDGTTEWIPPPHLDHGQRRTNNYFHPERMIRDDEEEDPE